MHVTQYLTILGFAVVNDMYNMMFSDLKMFSVEILCSACSKASCCGAAAPANLFPNRWPVRSVKPLRTDLQ